MPSGIGIRRGFARFALQFCLALLAGFGAATASAQSYDPGAITAFTVKFQDGVAPDATSALPDAVRSELYDALQVPFVQTGSTRDGAFRLELTNPQSLDQARALINRVRMLPDVLYASIETTPATAAGATQRKAPAAAAQGPLVRRLIVKYKDPTVSDDARANRPLPPGLVARLSTLAGQPVAHDHPMSAGAFVVRLFQGLPADQADALAKFLETDPAIDYAEPDLLRQPALVPNDTYYSADQWDLQSPPAEPGSVDLPAAWDLTTGSSSIVVGVIDTGILPHPDLIGRYLAGYDMIVDPIVANDQDPASCTVPGTCSSRDGNPTDPGDWVTSAESTGSSELNGCPVTNSSFHGTHVSGTIGAASNNGTGVAGINWTSKILPVRVLGKCGGYTSDIDDAIVWASGGSVPGVPANPNPARVLNLSLGGTGPCDTATQNAINSALAAGTVVVVAAGNSNSNASGFTPANCNGVITVAATGRQGQRASYSNYGASVEISAPGGSDGQAILSTLNNGTTSPNPSGYDYVYYQGTSMATPHVTGIASLMLSLAPSLTPAQVLATIQTTARAFPTGTVRDCTTALCGAGIVDAAAALRSLVSLSPSTTTLSSSANPATAGAPVTLTASVTGASPTGSVSLADGGSALSGCTGLALSGSGSTATAACTTSSLAAGTHSLVATYSGDAANAPSSSTTLSQVINDVTGDTNVALASVGAVASASSSYSSAFPVSAVNNNERAGTNWGNGGGWNDATAGVFPDWVQINFNGSKTKSEAKRA